jgi:hypothetical protein
VGEAGSGLSRFAREAAVLGRAEGWLVHEWACSDGDAPFSALRRPLRELILRGRAAPPRGRRPSDGELLALLGGPALWAAPGGLGGDARRALAAAIASFFTTRVQDRPLLVVLDDFERADEGSRRVIETLARHHGAERAGILVVTGEHEEAAPPGAELRLGPLGLVQARRLLASLPCMDRPPGARETEALIRASGRLPGRLARLGCLSGGPQRLLFPPLAEPRASA